MASGFNLRQLGRVAGVAVLVTGLVLFAQFYYDLAGGMQRLEDPGDAGPPGRRPLPADPARLTQLHEHLAQFLAAEENRIAAAVVVIFERKAFVGLQLAPHPSGDEELMAAEIMEDASIHLHSQEPRLVQIFITTEAPYTAQLRQIRDKVAGGEPVNHFAAQLGDMTEPAGRTGSAWFTTGNP